MLRKLIKKNFDRIVYSSAPVNRVFRNLNKLIKPFTGFRLRPYGVLRVTHGNVHFKMATNETSYVTKQLFWKGAHQFEYTPIFADLIMNCDSFIDVGANTGYYSMFAANANPSIAVHAFEPASGPFHFLKKNVEINDVGNRVFIHPVALSDQKGEVEFFEILNPSDTFAAYNLSGVGGLKKTHATQEHSKRKMVRAVPLDEFIKELGITQVDLIKIDTEGTENLVLEGAAETIRRHKPIIICETLFNKIEPQLEAIMRSHDYLFFNHVDGKLRQTDTLVRSKDDGVSDCFFVHPEKVKLILGFIESGS